MKIFFYNNDSFLNRLNPLSKIITFFPFLVLLCLVNNIWIPLIFIIFTVLIILILGNIPFMSFLKISAPILIFSISIFVLFLFVTRNDLTEGSKVLFSIYSFNIYENSAYLGLIYALRIYSLLILALPFGLSTEPSNFIRSLIQNVKIPYRFSYGVIVAFRFLPMMETEFNVVKSAHNVMGFSEDNGVFSYFDKIKRYSVPLIVNAIRIGNRTALSMDSRAFGAFPTRTFFKKLEFKKIDWIYTLSYWTGGVLIFIIVYKLGLMGELGFYLGAIG